MNRFEVPAVCVQLDAYIIGLVVPVTSDVSEEMKLAVVFNEMISDMPLHPMKLCSFASTPHPAWNRNESPKPSCDGSTGDGGWKKARVLHEDARLVLDLSRSAAPITLA